jgi:hypothetical protein
MDCGFCVGLIFDVRHGKKNCRPNLLPRSGNLKLTSLSTELFTRPDFIVSCCVCLAYQSTLE